MTRSVWKGPFLASCFFRSKYKSKQICTVCPRGSVIIPQFVGNKIAVHNGQKLIVILIKDDMVGHKFGEFSFTKKKPIHASKKNERL